MTDLGWAVAVAFLAPLILVAVTRGQQGLSWTKPLLLWAIAALALGLVLISRWSGDALPLIGLGAIGPQSFLWALLTVLALAVGSAVVMAAQRALGAPLGDKELYARIVAAPLPLRIFVVLTAGVVEEILYRGLGVGAGGLLIRDAGLATTLSVIAFTAAHLKWRASHLAQVALAGTILSLAFLLTRDLWVCVIAHLVVDALGFIVAPAFQRRAVRA